MDTYQKTAPYSSLWQLTPIAITLLLNSLLFSLCFWALIKWPNQDVFLLVSIASMFLLLNSVAILSLSFNRLKSKYSDVLKRTALGVDGLLIMVGLAFGIASAIDRGKMSGLEAVATIMILWPPILNAVAIVLARKEGGSKTNSEKESDRRHA